MSKVVDELLRVARILSRKVKLDSYQRKHLDAWLERQFNEDEREDAEKAIMAYLEDNPEAIDPERPHLNKGWMEMYERGLSL